MLPKPWVLDRTGEWGAGAVLQPIFLHLGREVRL